MIIDGHAHACGEYLICSSIEKILEKNNADKVVLVPGEPHSEKTYDLPNVADLCPLVNMVKPINIITRSLIKTKKLKQYVIPGNEYVAKLRNQLPERILQFVWITSDAHPGYLKNKYNQWKFHGIKLHQCWDSFKVDSPFFRTTALWAEEHGLPLFIHPWSDGEVRKIFEYKREHEDLMLIMAHLFGYEYYVQRGIKDKNVYFDISGVQTVSLKRLRSATEFIGPGNLILGTDTPYGKNNLKKSLARINSMILTDEEKALIMGENLRRILNL